MILSALRPTVLLAVALMAVIVMMILPMPAAVLDIGLAASFALAILIFTVTLFVEKPLDFSAFPTILLASLMLRLSLNVSSTKLIIGQGHTGPDAAGDVIAGFAMFVMGGSVFLGLVVFLVLMIVNFIVITKGAARMAEVGARFALDGMPGRQLAIDSDMSAGAIDHEEARRRRATEQAETTFFGSLDGASKFVKGDAVAGILITVLNLVMGLILGVAVHEMPLARAVETYAILTVGDGLVTQIPAVIISIASALLLARGGATGSIDLALFSQLGRHPAATFTVAALMALFALVPGLPFLPFMIGALLLAGAGVYLRRRTAAAAEAEEAGLEQPDRTAPQGQAIGDILDLDELHVEFAPDLVAMILDPATGLDARIANMRTYVARSFGFVLPEIRLTDDPGLGPGTYRIRVHGVEEGASVLRPGYLLAIAPPDTAGLPDGQDVNEPVYGAAARWIPQADAGDAALTGVTLAAPSEVLATHLMEIIKRNLGRLFGLKALRRLLDEMVDVSDDVRRTANRRLLDELVPDRVPTDVLLSVLRQLLEERVSIRNLPLILEAVAEARPGSAAPEAIGEHVRQRLGFQILGDLRRDDGTVPLVQMDDGWETVFREHQIDRDGSTPDVALPPDAFNRMVASVSETLTAVGDAGVFPGIVTTAPRRRFLRSALAARGIQNPVLSYEELGSERRPALVGTVAA